MNPSATNRVVGRSLTIAVLSSSLVLFQILLTRIFSVIFMSHLGFAAVSIGMLGLAASGVRLYTAPDKFRAQNAPVDVARAAVYYAASLIVCTLVLVHMGADALAFSWSLFAQLAVVYVIALIPFYFGGLALSLMLTQYQEQFALLYAADLAGAGLGGTLALFLLPVFGGPGALIFVALMVAAVAFSTCPPTDARVGRVGLALAGLCTLLLAFDNTAQLLHLKHPKGRGMTAPSAEPIFEQWNAFSRVALYSLPQMPWSVGPNYHGELQIVPLIDIDSSAATSIARADDARGNDYLSYELTSVGYSAAPKGRALVIGAGGGRDVLTALIFGMQHVDAVEINPIIVNEIMRGDFAEFSGHLYDDPRVTVHVGDGRSYVRHATDSYDLIQLSLVDTWAATAAGAFALSENNLYTVEALKDYIEHLTPNGILTFARWSGADVWRLIGELNEACKQLGIDAVPQHLAMVETPGQGSFITNLMFRRSPMDTVALAPVETQIKKAGFYWLYNPLDQASGRALDTQIATSADPIALAMQQSHTDLRPSFDDWPFFFYRPDNNFWAPLLHDPSNLFVKPQYLLVSLLLLSMVMSLACIVLPLMRGGRAATLLHNRRQAAGIMPYYAALGLGFMFVEVSLMQRFVLYLGHPTYALTVVLSALLVGAGIGALGASYAKTHILAAPQHIGWMAVGAAALLLGSAVLHPWLFGLTQGLAFYLRITMTLVMLVPVAVVMGTLMPLAMTCLHANAPELVPWAWGLNGFMSVLGSCAAALCAMTVGFTHTFQIGALFYGVAALTAFAGAFRSEVAES